MVLVIFCRAASGLACLVAAGGAVAAGPTDQAQPTITDPVQVWAMPTEQKAQAHPLRIEGRLNYYDPGFRLCWIERNKDSQYVQLSAHAPRLHTGQYVEIEGVITPNKGLDADDVKVRVTQEDAPITPLDIQGRINDLATLHPHVVTAEAYVDNQMLIDNEHVRLILIIENRPVICWVKPDDPGHVPDWRGSFVRVTGLYSARFDPTRTTTTIELWVGRQRDLQILGAIGEYALFERRRTPIGELYLAAPGTEVLVQGRIQSQRTGEALTVRDETGQLEIRSIQQQGLAVGTEVEAVGRVKVSGQQWVIENAFYRPARKHTSPDEAAVADGTLRTVAQVRALNAVEAGSGRPVDLRGMVTWALPDSDFFFLQDVTGGIRVHYDRAKTGAIPYLKYFHLEGLTRAGQVAPTVELRTYTDLGAMSHPRAKPIVLEQALTGREEGEWVELRGFLQGTESQGDWRWIHVTTPAGEFTGHLQNPVNFVATPGSLVRIRGVCETNTDSSGRITGVTLRVPFLHDITVEEEAPADFYDLPLRAIGSLPQPGAGRDLTRVRIAGVVLHAVPGRSVFVQDASGVIQLLTAEKISLRPGDRIEAVGILGREGVRPLLVSGVCRKTGAGAPPEPRVLEEPGALSLANDSHLVQVRGTLIYKFNQPGLTRLTMQDGATIFEATLERGSGIDAPDSPLDAGLALTGIYRLDFDDTNRMQGFHLQLRSPADLTVYQAPHLWTARRAIVLSTILAGCILLGLAWIVALRRRVRQQTEQLRRQFEHQSRLEIEVQHAARLESLGVLAGGIAHDFNNALTGIMGYTTFAMLDKQAMALVGTYLKEIERGAHRASNLTQQLLTFAKGGDPVRATVMLPALVWEASELLLHGTKVNCNLTTPPGLWNIHADKGQITLVLQNLIRNAMQAMPHGGEIQVVLANEEIIAGAKSAHPAGRYVRLAITDRGEGIEPEHLPRIFDPYFSTRRSGGLGLATVYSIVKKHRGFLDVQSAKGAGTTFRIWLPAADLTEPTAAPAFAAPPSPPAQPRVLLMDDEESIRELGLLMLKRMGLETTTVADGVMAVEEFNRAKAAGRPYRLVILDLSIAGGMGGVETMDQLRKLDPGLLAIVSSGYSDDPVMADYRAYGFHAMVPKPYNITQFTQTVERLLG